MCILCCHLSGRRLFRVSANGTVYLRAGAKGLILDYYRQLSFQLLVLAADVSWTMVPVAKAATLSTPLNVSIARTSVARVNVEIAHGTGVITPVGTVIVLTLFTWSQVLLCTVHSHVVRTYCTALNVVRVLLILGVQTFWFWWAVAGCAVLALLVVLVLVALMCALHAYSTVVAEHTIFCRISVLYALVPIESMSMSS